MSLLKNVIKSIVSPTFYNQTFIGKFGISTKAFIKVSLTLLIIQILFIFFNLIFVKTIDINKVVSTYSQTITNTTIAINDGIVSTPLNQIFYVPKPYELNYIFNNVIDINDFNNLLVVDPNIRAADFDSNVYRSFMVIGENFIKINHVNIVSIEKSTTIKAINTKDTMDGISNNSTLVIITIFLILAVIFILKYIFFFIIILFVAAISKVVANLLKTKWKYEEALNATIWAANAALIVDFTINILNIFSNTTNTYSSNIFGIVLILNILLHTFINSKEKHNTINFLEDKKETSL